MNIVYTSRLHVIFVVLFVYALVGPLAGNAIFAFSLGVATLFDGAVATLPERMEKAGVIFSLLFLTGIKFYFFAWLIGGASAVAVGLFAGIIQAGGQPVPPHALMMAALTAALAHRSWCKSCLTPTVSQAFIMIAAHVGAALVCAWLTRNVVRRSPNAQRALPAAPV